MIFSSQRRRKARSLDPSCCDRHVAAQDGQSENPIHTPTAAPTVRWSPVASLSFFSKRPPLLLRPSHTPPHVRPFLSLPPFLPLFNTPQLKTALLLLLFPSWHLGILFNPQLVPGFPLFLGSSAKDPLLSTICRYTRRLSLILYSTSQPVCPSCCAQLCPPRRPLHFCLTARFSCGFGNLKLLSLSLSLFLERRHRIASRLEGLPLASSYQR